MGGFGVGIIGLSIQNSFNYLLLTQTQPNPIIMGKPQPTQLPYYENYQNSPKVKNSNLTAPPLILLWFESEVGKFHQISPKKKKKITTIH